MVRRQRVSPCFPDSWVETRSAEVQSGLLQDLEAGYVLNLEQDPVAGEFIPSLEGSCTDMEQKKMKRKLKRKCFTYSKTSIRKSWML